MERIAVERTDRVVSRANRPPSVVPRREGRERRAVSASTVQRTIDSLAAVPARAPLTALGKIRRTPSRVVAREYDARRLPVAVATKAEAEALLERVYNWGKAMVGAHEPLGAPEKGGGLRAALARLHAIIQPLRAANHDDPNWPAAVSGQLANMQSEMGLSQRAWEQIGAGQVWAAEGSRQEPDTKYVDAKEGGAHWQMLRALSNQANTDQPFDLRPEWSTAPIAIAADHPKVPEALRVLIRFIAAEDSAVGLAYRNPQQPAPAPATAGAAATGPEQRGPHVQPGQPAAGHAHRGTREFEKDHFGLTRSWHIDEKGRLPDTTDQERAAARGGNGRAGDYLAANETDFANGAGVPEKLRGKSVAAEGYVEFNSGQIGDNGRIVYDYLRHRFYFTPCHYDEWVCPLATTPERKLHPFFELTGTENLILTLKGTQELARLRYWESRRREGRITL